MSHKVELEDARVATLARVLGEVLAILKRDGGFRTPVQQATIRGARALLAEIGSGLDREDA